MGKTLEARNRAEEEKRVVSEKSVITSETENVTISSQVTEQYSTFKQNILRNNLEKQIKVLLFSSATKGEGNSTVLTHFAVKLASEGEKVLIVDANLRDPSFHKIFDLERDHGLTELFFEKSTLKGIIKETRFTHLSVITSGALHSNPFIILGSNRLDSSIAEMKAEADWVLFDSPPINFFNDAIALAPRVDGVVMVVEAEKTRWEVARSAKQRIESGNGKILGAILNKRRFYIPTWLYRTL